jgi:surface polysaccharide O-acyltransferase-like enzyme
VDLAYSRPNRVWRRTVVRFAGVRQFKNQMEISHPSLTTEHLGARNPALDALKAICMVYIVGFWHLFDYCAGADWHHNWLTYRLTVVALAVFMFISGYLVGRRGDSISQFYLKRFVRIYIPFVAASLLFILVGYGDRVAALKGIFLISVFHGPSPYTLWFVTVLLVFILVAPILRSARDSAPRFSFVAVPVLMLLILYQAYIGGLDPRVIIYFPAFVAGVYLSGRQLTGRWAFIIGIGAIFGLIIAERAPSGQLEFDYSATGWAFFGAILIVLGLLRIMRDAKPIAFLSFLSAAGYFAYIFHRVILRLLFNVLPPALFANQYAYLLGVVLPCLMWFSWILQRKYDRMIAARLFSLAAGAREQVSRP